MQSPAFETPKFESSSAISAQTNPRRSGTANPVVRRSQFIPVPAPRSGLAGRVGYKAAIVSLAIGVTILQTWKSIQTKPVASAHAAEVRTSADARLVTTTHPEPAQSGQVLLAATIRPLQTTTLHARVSGYLASWNRELGSTVKAGEVLATIETPELDQEVAQAEASYHEATAAAVQAKAEQQEAEADLRVAEAQVLRARADAELSALQLTRREALVKVRAASEEEVDTFKKQTEARTADVRAAESDVSRRKSNLETRAAVITAREATAKSRQANVERLKELQEFKHILAPFDGIVTSRTAEIGMLVTAGKEALFTIEDMSRVRVQVHVPQAYAAQTLPGTAASVIIPEEANKPVAGKITRIAEGVDATNRTMLAEVELENPSRRFQPGSYAKVALTTSADSSTWTIPTNTLQMRIEGPHVAVVDEHQMVELRPVQLGRDLGRRVIVVAGIAGDERLVVNPGDDLTTGTSVQTAGAAKHQSVAMRSNSAEVTE